MEFKVGVGVGECKEGIRANIPRTEVGDTFSMFLTSHVHIHPPAQPFTINNIPRKYPLNWIISLKFV